MVTPAIDIQKVSKVFRSGFLQKKSHALTDLTLEIPKNEILGYLGPNGSGKTTTFKIILGLIAADSGVVYFNGKSCESLDPRSLLGYLPENPYFYNFLTGEEILAYYGKLFGLSGEPLSKRIDMLFHQVGLSHARKKLTTYSRGMLQRIGIAQALINDPEILILDEPMSGLDPYGRKEMRDIILSCRDKGKTVIFSSHILSDVEMMCDKAAIILNGDLKDVVDVADLLHRKVKYWEVTSARIDNELKGQFEQKGVGFIFTKDMVLGKFKERKLAQTFMNEMNRRGQEVISFAPQRENLEDIFVKFTKSS